MGDTRMSFGDLLRRLRSTAGLSQEDLAERSGVSRNGISDLERGLSHTPRFETVRLLADGLALTDDKRASLLSRGTAGSARCQRVGIVTDPSRFVADSPDPTH